jgi:putative endonuclease
MNTYQRGLLSEFISRCYLRINGYRILEQRLRTPVGEIDLVARKRNTLVFIEVKARKDHIKAVESLSRRQQIRIEKSAQFYLSKLDKQWYDAMRFDVILLSKWGNLKHLEDAWRP